MSQQDSETTSDYGSREGEVEDEVEEVDICFFLSVFFSKFCLFSLLVLLLIPQYFQDPEKIRKAGNDLFNAENIEGALEKYKEAIACGERGSQMSAESLSKTYR